MLTAAFLLAVDDTLLIHCFIYIMRENKKELQFNEFSDGTLSGLFIGTRSFLKSEYNDSDVALIPLQLSSTT